MITAFVVAWGPPWFVLVVLIAGGLFGIWRIHLLRGRSDRAEETKRIKDALYRQRLATEDPFVKWEREKNGAGAPPKAQDRDKP